MTQTTQHIHRAIPNYTPDRQRRFFALLGDLKLDPNEYKEKAKNYFKKDCFNDFTNEELNRMIRSLVKKQNQRNLN